jgi:hypothetical protein
MEFVPGYRAAHAPKREKRRGDAARDELGRVETRGRGDALPSPLPPPEGQGEGNLGELPPTNEDSSISNQQSAISNKKKEGNGHGPRIDIDTAKPFAYTDEELRDAHSAHLQAPEVGGPTPSAANLRLAIVADPLSQQGTNLQADAPACDVCGSITVRSGTCYKCLNCGNSMGCS